MKIERDQVTKVYDEVARRIDDEIRDGMLETAGDVHEEWCIMLQGVYSTLMMLAGNWPEVRSWCDEEEAERGIFNDDP